MAIMSCFHINTNAISLGLN